VVTEHDVHRAVHLRQPPAIDGAPGVGVRHESRGQRQVGVGRSAPSTRPTSRSVGPRPGPCDATSPTRTAVRVASRGSSGANTAGVTYRSSPSRVTRLSPSGATSTSPTVRSAAASAVSSATIPPSEWPTTTARVRPERVEHATVHAASAAGV
jgi:hypothetical protein